MDMWMSALTVVTVGLAIGLATRPYVRGRAPEAFLSSTLVGLAGAVSATLLGVALDWHLGGTAAILGAAVGAALLVAAHHLAARALG